MLSTANTLFLDCAALVLYVSLAIGFLAFYVLGPTSTANLSDPPLSRGALQSRRRIRRYRLAFWHTASLAILALPLWFTKSIFLGTPVHIAALLSVALAMAAFLVGVIRCVQAAARLMLVELTPDARSEKSK